jgi:transcriptional regulator GlxA family with amidase domain
MHSRQAKSSQEESSIPPAPTNEVGVTIHQHLMRARIEAAKTLLRDTDLPVTAIALELGYAASHHFSMAFKSATGRSPTTSRKKNRRNAPAADN